MDQVLWGRDKAAFPAFSTASPLSTSSLSAPKEVFCHQLSFLGPRDTSSLHLYNPLGKALTLGWAL